MENDPHQDVLSLLSERSSLKNGVGPATKITSKCTSFVTIRHGSFRSTASSGGRRDYHHSQKSIMLDRSHCHAD